jgi:lipopolysaccharide biosynthesis protein
MYLPQFHPIPENDAWWGKGFTEWTNVTKARPFFRGHYQPHLPADLGFYDLRLSEVREAQAELARQYGIHGFCYYHYWFNGRRLLERPFQEVLASGRPDFPFCLCWANETWTRRWLGEEREALLTQSYSPEDDRRHARWLVKAFTDSRYVRKDGRPIFLIYRPGHLPCAKHTTDVLREECAKHGEAEPYLIGVDAHHPGKDSRSDGFDATLQFEPQLGALPGAFDDRPLLRRMYWNLRIGAVSPRLKLYDYREARARMNSIARPFPTIPCVFVRWDNTPRRGKGGIVIVNSSPHAFGRELRATVSALLARDPNEPLLFINAWNEWAEGNHLEPDQRDGTAYLEQVRTVVKAELT